VDLWNATHTHAVDRRAAGLPPLQPCAPNLPAAGLAAAVHTVGFRAAATRIGFSMGIGERARSILSDLGRAGIGTDRPVVFLTHSMGGLIAKAMLVESPRLLRQCRGIIFFGTPHAGSFLADALRGVGLGSRAVRDLRARSEELTTLHASFSAAAAASGLQVLSFVEQGKELGIVQIVPSRSATISVGRTIPIECGHLAICKPASRNDVVYRETLAAVSTWVVG
jgi:pimeloyl-ACP methyl ester carboxylesterase